MNFLNYAMNSFRKKMLFFSKQNTTADEMTYIDQHAEEATFSLLALVVILEAQTGIQSFPVNKKES